MELAMEVPILAVLPIHPCQLVHFGRPMSQIGLTLWSNLEGTKTRQWERNLMRGLSAGAEVVSFLVSRRMYSRIYDELGRGKVNNEWTGDEGRRTVKGKL